MSNIEALAADWIETKKAINAAQKKLLAIDNQLIEALGAQEEGAETHEVGDLKVVITGKLTRTLDPIAWDSVKNRIDHAMWPVATKVAIDLKGVRYLQNNEPDIWKQINTAFTTKPAKTAVAVKVV